MDLGNTLLSVHIKQLLLWVSEVLAMENVDSWSFCVLFSFTIHSFVPRTWGLFPFGTNQNMIWIIQYGPWVYNEAFFLIIVPILFSLLKTREIDL